MHATVGNILNLETFRTGIDQLVVAHIAVVQRQCGQQRKPHSRVQAASFWWMEGPAAAHCRHATNNNSSMS